jgi:DNA replicative helicase MCM subunit Mcm2 (Cdc46/Mcm family)
MESQDNQENLAQNGGDQNPKGWMDLLRRYISKAPKKTPKEQEEETTKIFLDILKEDKKNEENQQPKIPRFFF